MHSKRLGEIGALAFSPGRVAPRVLDNITFVYRELKRVLSASRDSP